MCTVFQYVIFFNICIFIVLRMLRPSLPIQSKENVCRIMCDWFCVYVGYLQLKYCVVACAAVAVNPFPSWFPARKKRKRKKKRAIHSIYLLLNNHFFFFFSHIYFKLLFNTNLYLFNYTKTLSLSLFNESIRRYIYESIR